MDNIKESPYLLVCVGKLLVCRNYYFKSKIYILYFAYAIHGTHHDLLKKQDKTTGNEKINSASPFQIKKSIDKLSSADCSL